MKKKVCRGCQVVKGGSLSDLNKKMAELVKEGYQPSGGIFVDTHLGFGYQTMVKYEEVIE